MAGTIEQKLAAQGVVLHEPASPVANYVGFVRTGNLLFVSGQVCVDAEGKLIAKGKLGAGVTVEQGNAAARGCAINLLAQIKAALGDLDKVVRVVRLGGFVNSAPDFLDGPKVLNGASLRESLVDTLEVETNRLAPDTKMIAQDQRERLMKEQFLKHFPQTQRWRSKGYSRSHSGTVPCARQTG